MKEATGCKKFNTFILYINHPSSIALTAGDLYGVCHGLSRKSNSPALPGF
jgi:hypothetical protein